MISFTSDRDGDWDIYVINADGSGEVNLTNNSVYDGSATWSPDKTKISFASEPAGPPNREVMVMNADGSGRARLTNDGFNHSAGEWSPQGLPMLAFARWSYSIAGQPGDILIIRPDGTGQTNLTNSPEDEKYPRWSPDGTKIAYVVSDQQLWIMNRDGTNKRRLPTNGSAGQFGQYAWSPDGSRIAFRQDRDATGANALELYVINADGAGLINLSNTTDAFETGFEWSPDGSKIVFERYTAPSFDVWVMNADGTGQVNITNTGNTGAAVSPTWSPDGTHVALVRSDNSGNHIIIMKADGSERALLTPSSAQYSGLRWIQNAGADPGDTPPGNAVPVSPIDQTTGNASPIDLLFEAVTAPGTTTVTSGTVGGGGPPPPANFRLGSPPTFFDIQTTATYNGTITVCFNYAGVSYGNERNLKLLHEEKDANGNSHWVDRTTSLDTDADIICGVVTSLSPFLAAEQNVAPVVTRISIPTAPIAVGSSVTVTADFTDANPRDSHTATFDWEAGTSTGTVEDRDGAGSVIGSRTYQQAGVYTVVVSVSDGDLSAARTSANDVPAYIVVYDQSAGFVTGGGWINSPAGACQLTALCGSATGKATFGFVAKYKNGATVPTGDTEFQFRTGNLKFQSTSYEWLVVAGSRAKYKGEGQINGAGAYRFMITAIDGDLNSGLDQFRIKITDQAGRVMYDNKRGDPEDSDAATPIGGGSIVIHK